MHICIILTTRALAISHPKVPDFCLGSPWTHTASLCKTQLRSLPGLQRGLSPWQTPQQWRRAGSHWHHPPAMEKTHHRWHWGCKVLGTSLTHYLSAEKLSESHMVWGTLKAFPVWRVTVPNQMERDRPCTGPGVTDRRNSLRLTGLDGILDGICCHRHHSSSAPELVPTQPALRPAMSCDHSLLTPFWKHCPFHTWISQVKSNLQDLNKMFVWSKFL